MRRERFRRNSQIARLGSFSHWQSGERADWAENVTILKRPGATERCGRNQHKPLPKKPSGVILDRKSHDFVSCPRIRMFADSEWEKWASASLWRLHRSGRGAGDPVHLSLITGCSHTCRKQTRIDSCTMTRDISRQKIFFTELTLFVFFLHVPSFSVME